MRNLYQNQAPQELKPIPKWQSLTKLYVTVTHKILQKNLSLCARFVISLTKSSIALSGDVKNSTRCLSTEHMKLRSTSKILSISSQKLERTLLLLVLYLVLERLRTFSTLNKTQISRLVFKLQKICTFSTMTIIFVTYLLFSLKITQTHKVCLSGLAPSVLLIQ